MTQEAKAVITTVLKTVKDHQLSLSSRAACLGVLRATVGTMYMETQQLSLPEARELVADINKQNAVLGINN